VVEKANQSILQRDWGSRETRLSADDLETAHEIRNMFRVGEYKRKGPGELELKNVICGKKNDTGFS